MIFSLKFPSSGFIGLLLALVFVSSSTFAQYLTQPQPGDIYKEFSRIMDPATKQWRITDPNALASGAQQDKPNSVLYFTIGDTAGAIRAEAILNVWGGHQGTTGKKFRLNGKPYITIPEMGVANGIPVGHQGQCYDQWLNYVIAVPLNNLKEGQNTIDGTNTGQTCYNFNWGLFGWYDATIRVYYNSSKPHATGSITSPASGSTIFDNPTLAASATSGAGINKVEFFASYEGWDPDGDGIYGGYQYAYHRLKNETTVNPKFHAGTALSSPYQVIWNTSLVPDQVAGSMKLIARIRDNAGTYFVTNEVTGLTLQRDSISVKLYKPIGVPEKFSVRSGGTTKTCTFTIPAGDNLARALSAKLIVRTWNGTDAPSVLPDYHYIRINSDSIPNNQYGADNFPSLDIVTLRTGALLTGTNTFKAFANTSLHHGVNIEWPGPAILVTYSSTPLVLPSITQQPVGATINEGQTVTFNVAATGSNPISFQWQKNNVNINGANNPSYTTPALPASDNGSVFRCVVSNAAGSVNSNGATVIVNGTPVTIIRHPASQTVGTGKSATFSVEATGSAPYTYQWQKNGSNIAGATGAWYTTPVTVIGDNGATFRCVVSNMAGPQTSNSATLTVVAGTPASMIVSDDFNATQLNTGIWKYINPRNDSPLGMTGAGTQNARANVTVPAAVAHDIWTDGINGPRFMQIANNTDFEVELKFESALNAQYQMEGLLVEQDDKNFIRFDFVRRSNETRVYCATFVNNVATQRWNNIITIGNPSYMKVKRTGNTWQQYYSTSGTAWTSVGTFTFATSVGRIGPWFGNAGSPVPSFAGTIDYFFNNALRISPEDGSLVAPGITVQPVNQSTTLGTPVTFNITAFGSVPLNYQWQRDSVDIPSATNSSYTIPPPVEADNGSTYRCVVTNAVGTATSNNGVLTVGDHASGIHSDDFNQFALNTSLWTIIDPVANGFRAMTETNTPNAAFTVTLPAGIGHDAWSAGNYSYRLLQPSNNVDFELDAKFLSTPTTPFQLQGILIQQDIDNYLRFDFLRNISGLTVYSASILNATATERINFPISPGSPLWLKVRRIGNQWTELFSFDGISWTTAGTYSRTLSVTSVGPFFGTGGANPPEFVGKLDYFQLTEEPLFNEDGNTATDNFPPVIANIQAIPGASGFTVDWITDEPTIGRVDYGLTNTYELGTVEHQDLRLLHTLSALNLQPLTTYNIRVRAEDESGNTSASNNLQITTTVPTPPVFNIWYGKNQTFGLLGNPAPRINILGNVADSNGVLSLLFSLNGQPQESLSRGPDTRRLVRKGDFDIDLLYSRLSPGPNTIILTAVDSQFTPAYDTVTVNYVAGNSWPKAYSVDWSTVAQPQDAVQILDGKWTIQNNELKNLETGYDRLIAIGEQSWVDYEITVPITVDAIDSAGFVSPSNGAAIGFLFRWPGHSDGNPASTAGLQPKSGFLPLGCFSVHNWEMDGTQTKRMLGDQLRLLGEDNSGGVLQLGVKYMYKMRVTTTPGIGGLYKMKIWVAGTPEPSTWNLQGQEPMSGPQSGCLLIVAHQVYPRIGNINIVPLDEGSIITSDDFNSATLNNALWTFQNPRGDATLQMVGAGTGDAKVQISVPGGIVHEAWTPRNTSARIMQPANNSTSFELDAKFDSQFTLDTQVHGILVQQDTNNYIRFDYSSSGTSTRVFAGTIQNGVYQAKGNLLIATGLPQFMRVKRLGAVWQLYYSYNNIDWVLGANFSQSLNVTSVGPYVGNTNSTPANSPAYTGVIDYFFNGARPIVPEDDGVSIVSPVVVTEPVAQTVASADSARFTVGVSGTPPLTYRWQKDNVDIVGATGASYTLPSASVASDNGAKFRCIVSNSAGADTSIGATLTVLYPPSTFISDDFHTGSLNTGVWRFVNPLNDASISFTGVGTTNARLQISIPGGTTHDIWTTGPQAPRIMQDVNNTNFEIEAKFESGVSTNYQEQGFFIQQNAQNFLRFDFVTHPTSNITRLYSASFINLAVTPRIQLNGPAKGVQPLWLKVNRTGDTWTMYYSTNGSSWTTAGTFVHAMTVDSVGVFAGNAGSPVPSFTSIVDYAFNTVSPLAPEDGVPPGIASHPANTTIAEGRRASFSVIGSGSPPFSYQWQRNGINITNATSTSYTTQPMSLADSGATYRCIVSNSFGSINSNNAILSVVPAQPLPWWNSKWAFRLPLEVRSNAYERYDKPVERKINFTQAMAILNVGGGLDTSSIRVIEVDSNHAILDTLVDQQFDLDSLFNATNYAVGELIFMMDGVTNANAVRYYDVYFDTVGGGSFTLPPVANRVVISDTTYRYYPSWKIVTDGGTLYYHKPGGAFASYFDQNGRDWIGWDSTTGATGIWRGIPNNGDAFHPGFTTATSWIIKAGPLRVRFRSRTTNSLWETEWDVFPKYARNIMLRRGATWWWLYEGTPGGSYEFTTDYVVRPSGLRTLANVRWSGDIGPQEWAYFGDPTMSRILYTAKHEDDTAPEIFRDQDEGMTVFGFGRKDPCCIRYLDAVPQTFTFGFAEDSAFTPAKKSINSAYKDLQVTQQDPQIEGSTGGATLSIIVSDNFNAPSLNSDLWTYYNPRGDATLSMNGNSLVINVPGGIGVSHDVWTGGNFAPRVMQPANDVNFEVEAKFNSFLGLGFQIQGIIVEQDPANYIRFDFVRNSSTVNLFAATFAAGVPTVNSNTPITSGNPLYLRVKRIGNTWTQSYSYDGVNWTAGATFDYDLDVTSVGPFFGNGSNPAPSLVGVIDYFYNTEVPISPTKAHGTDRPKEDALPTVFSLSPNYPNPFNPQTTISYGLPEPANVTLKIYNMLGQEIATIVDEQQNAGYYRSVWAGKNNHGAIVGSGVYIYRMTATSASGNVFTNTRKMILTH